MISGQGSDCLGSEGLFASFHSWSLVRPDCVSALGHYLSKEQIYLFFAEIHVCCANDQGQLWTWMTTPECWKRQWTKDELNSSTGDSLDHVGDFFTQKLWERKGTGPPACWLRVSTTGEQPGLPRGRRRTLGSPPRIRGPASRPQSLRSQVLHLRRWIRFLGLP